MSERTVTRKRSHRANNSELSISIESSMESPSTLSPGKGWQNVRLIKFSSIIVRLYRSFDTPFENLLFAPQRLRGYFWLGDTLIKIV